MNDSPISPDDQTVSWVDKDAGDSEQTQPALGGRYVLLRRLGEGGFGAVHLARDTLLNRDVAIKLLSATAGQPGEVRERFLREARASAQFQHPNVVSLYDAGDDKDRGLFLVLEFVSGSTLAEMMKGGAIEPDRAALIMQKVATALAAAHERGIVHRDIKPANILITPEGTVKVADFGIASIAGEQGLTTPGALIGTPSYMSPEQVNGHTIGAASDLFSLGSVVYELLTGRRPFRGSTISELAGQIARGSVAEVDPRERERAPDLWKIVDRLLSQDPAQRGSAAGVAVMLADEPLRKPAPRSRKVWLAVALLILGVLTVMVANWPRSTTPRQTTQQLDLLHASAGDVLLNVNRNFGFVRSAEGLRSLELTAIEHLPSIAEGSLGGISVKIRESGPKQIELTTSEADQKRAAGFVRIIDELSQTRFTSEPNLFTDATPSRRTIRLEGEYPAVDLIELIASAAGMPLVVDGTTRRSANADVSLVIPESPWDSVIRSLAERAKVSIGRVGDIWVLETDTRAQERRARSSVELRVTLVKFDRKDLERVATTLRSALGPEGLTLVSERLGGLVFIGNEPTLKSAAHMAQILDGGAPSASSDRPKSNYQGALVSLHLSQANLNSVLEMFGRLAGLGVVVDPAVRGRTINARISEVAWDNAFDAVLAAAALTYTMEGNVARVSPPSAAHHDLDVATLRLANELPSWFLPLEQIIAPSGGALVADDHSRTLIVRGEKAAVKRLTQLVSDIDRAPAPNSPH